MARPSNPIEQRIIHFFDTWQATRSKEELSLIRIQSKETNMVETFIHYLFGMDNDSTDVPLILDIHFQTIDTYSIELLHEIEELIYLWNNVEDNKTGMELPTVDWKPNYDIDSNANPAQLFVENINDLANYLELQEDAFLVIHLDEEAIKKWGHLRWFQFALDAGIDKQVKLLVVDTPENPYFKTITKDNFNNTEVIVPNFSLDTAMQQIAVMGDPKDPLVQYRKAFNLLSQAVGKRDKKSVKNHSNECIKIAKANTTKDPNWYGQYIVVYTLLINDQIGYKNYNNALEIATKSVEIAQSIFPLFKEDFIPNKFLAQTLMTRGSLYVMTKEWLNCAEDFSSSFAILFKTNDAVLAIECARMNAYANSKAKRLKESKDILISAYTLAKKTPAFVLKTSTFGGVIEYLFELNIDEHINKQEYTDFFKSVYGDQWRVEHQAWKKPTKIEDEQPTEPITA